MNNSLLGVTRISIGSSATITSLMAGGVGTAALASGLRRLLLVPVSSVACSLAPGAAATANHAAIPTGGLDMPIGLTDAKTLQVYSATGGAKLDVFQFGNRS